MTNYIATGGMCAVCKYGGPVHDCSLLLFYTYKKIGKVTYKGEEYTEVLCQKYEKDKIHNYEFGEQMNLELSPLS